MDIAQVAPGDQVEERGVCDGDSHRTGMSLRIGAADREANARFASWELTGSPPPSGVPFACYSYRLPGTPMLCKPNGRSYNHGRITQGDLLRFGPLEEMRLSV